MALNDTLEFSIHSTYAGQELVNTYHFRIINPGLAGPLTPEQQCVDAWQAACLTQYRAILTTSMNVDRMSARQICGTLPLRARVDESVAQPGTRSLSATDATAPWLACLVRKRSAFAGKSYQGRNFYPVGTEGDFIGVTLQGVILTPVNALNTALLAAFGPSGTSPDFQLVIHSNKLASVPGTQCQNSSSPVISLATSTYLTTMRSRRSRSGV